MSSFLYKPGILPISFLVSIIESGNCFFLPVVLKIELLLSSFIMWMFVIALPSTFIDKLR